MANPRAALEADIKKLNEELAAIKADIEQEIKHATTLGTRLSNDPLIESRLSNELKDQTDKLKAIHTRLADFPTPTDDDFKDDASINALNIRLQEHANKINLAAAKAGQDAITKNIKKIETGFNDQLAKTLQAAKADAAKKLEDVNKKYKDIATPAKQLLDGIKADAMLQKVAGLDELQKELETRYKALDIFYNDGKYKEFQIAQIDDDAARANFVEKIYPEENTLLTELEVATKAVKAAIAKEKDEKDRIVAELKKNIETAEATATAALAQLSPPIAHPATFAEPTVGQAIKDARDALEKLAERKKLLGATPGTDNFTAAEITAKDGFSDPTNQEIINLNTKLKTATTAYSKKFAEIAKIAEVESARNEFAALAQSQVDTASNIIKSLEAPAAASSIAVIRVKPKLVNAQEALNKYLAEQSTIDDDDKKNAFHRETDKRSTLLNNVTDAINTINTTIYDEMEQLRKAELKKVDDALAANETSVKTFYAKEPALINAISKTLIDDTAKKRDALVTLKNQLVNPTIQPLNLDDYSKALTEYTSFIAKENIPDKINAMVAADAAINTSMTAYELQKFINDNLATFNANMLKTFPDAAIWGTVDPAIRKPFEDYKTALETHRKKITFDAATGKSKLDNTQLATLKKDVTKVTTADIEATAAKTAYETAAKAAAKAAADAADTAAKKLNNDKDTLKASINSVTNENSVAHKLLATIGLTNLIALKDHVDKITARINKLLKLKDQLTKNTTTQTDIDASPDGLKKQIDAQIAALKDLTDKAKKNVDYHRVQHVKATFNRYKERIKLIEGLLDVIARPDTANKYKNTIAEVERMLADLEAYKDWLVYKKNNTDAVDELIAKINKITAELNAAALPADYGMRYYGKLSERVKGTDDATFQAAIDALKKQLLDEAKILDASPNLSHGTLVSKTNKGSEPSRFTAGFHGLINDDSNRFVGRVTVNETTSSNTVFKKSPIVSTCVQRIKDGAHVSEIEFKEFDDSKSLHSQNGVTARLPNDRVLKHAIKDVLNHILAEKSPGLKDITILTDDMIAKLLKGQIDPALKQLHASPIYINGSLHDNYAEAVMLFCDYLKIECHDTRKESKNCHVIKKLDRDRSYVYREAITKQPERYFGDTKPIVTPTKTIKALDVDTTPKLTK